MWSVIRSTPQSSQARWGSPRVGHLDNNNNNTTGTSIDVTTVFRSRKIPKQLAQRSADSTVVLAAAGSACLTGQASA